MDVSGMIAFRRRVARRNWSRIRFATARWRYDRNAPSCIGSNESSRARLCCSVSWTTSLVSMPPRTHGGIRPRAHRRSQVLYRSNSLSIADRLPRRARSSRRRSDVEPSEAGSPRGCEDEGTRSGGTTAADHASARRRRETHAANAILRTPAHAPRTPTSTVASDVLRHTVLTFNSHGVQRRLKPERTHLDGSPMRG